MHIEVAKRDLVDALKVAATAMTSVPNTPIESHYVFRVQDGKAEVLTSSKRTFCGTPLTCRVESGGDGAFTIEGWRLRQWLQAVGDVAISFEYKDGMVEVSSPRGKMSFSSLDPSTYHYFDENVESAEVVATVNSARLGSVFAYLQPLILDRETTHAQMSLTEVHEGSLYATNIETMTVVRMTNPEVDGETPLVLADSQMRIHVKDVKNIQSFLKLDSDVAVEVLEDKDKCLMIRRPDGSVFGTARPQAAFPKFPDVSLDTKDDVYFTVSSDEITSAITWLLAGAKKDAEKVRARWVDGSIVLSMEAQSGGEVKLPIELIEHDGLDDGMPPVGFKVLYSYINMLMQQFGADKVRFGVRPKRDEDGEFNGKGYLRLRHEAGGDTYQTLVAWVQ